MIKDMILIVAVLLSALVLPSALCAQTRYNAEVLPNSLEYYELRDGLANCRLKFEREKNGGWFTWDALDLTERDEEQRKGTPAGRPSKQPPPSEPVANFRAAVMWLENEAHRLIRASVVPMNDGTLAFPPQVGSGYKAFWLRDYVYALEGSIESFSNKELTDACRLFVKSICEDGAGVDCIKYDDTPIYKPGYGRAGREPVLDGPPFMVSVAWLTYQRTKDKDLLKGMLEPLVKTMKYMPRNPANGLAHIKYSNERREYGFTDTILKTGDTLFCSLLFVQASRQLGDLLEADGRQEEAGKWRKEAQRVGDSVRNVFWDKEVGLFRAATGDCNVPDIWGSAFAVWLDVATREQAQAIAGYFKQHYGEIVQDGQVRHIPGFTDWKGNKIEKNGGKYQTGAFWATPVGWFVYTLDLADSALADQTVVDMVRYFQKHGACECIDGEYRKLPGYMASASLPLDGIRAMVARRSVPQQLKGAVKPVDLSHVPRRLSLSGTDWRIHEDADGPGRRTEDVRCRR